ncbi:MAG: NEL-type E3 ubiquitin ligase domain-containing protein [Candidatus Pseudomonas phytovorans]|uniref:RING-type E3 ubiquitin transferase n=1 Tax=Candidatus Pseudomonas phytovorans TaxID=3121377 RepID=A0AAJ6BC32_9PSED|nr:NEL-type E3 ubiquitin ligase domain-containing protein [Pseudomonas sp.]WEK29211.1 MAG: NEL-type E3 ubiquitin ligase domain-containing protein [Pseudomonas sp.]
MPTPAPSDDSIDTLIASRMPGWLAQPPASRLVELHDCLREQQAAQQRVSALFSSLVPMDEFAAPLLHDALLAPLAQSVDVRKATLRMHLIERYPSSRPEAPGGVRERTLQHSLLAAALHNFSDSESRSLGVKDQSMLLDGQGQALPMTARAFAECCRAIDIGGQYQAYLQAQLTAPGDAGAGVATLLEQGQRLALEAALRMAALQADIDETALVQCMAAITPAPGAVTRMRPAALRVFGKRVRGAVAFELHRDGLGEGPLEGVVCWLPDDPYGAVSWHTSWDKLFQGLGKRFRLPGYPEYFQRFVSERDREGYAPALAHARAQGGTHVPVELDGRYEVISEPLFQHLRKVLLATLFDDAQVLAVPTAVQDSAERDRRLHFYAGLGLDLLGLASFYVAGLGLPLLGIAALQVVDDVYEGYEDWHLGDRQGALEHAFSVAVNVAQTVVAAGTGVAHERLMQRAAFVDALVPVRTEGAYKLFDPRLEAYAVGNDPIAIGQYAVADGKARLRTHQAVYQVIGDPLGGELRIQHPQREGAYAPKLWHLGGGAWRHELDTPQTWQGGELLRRLGSGVAEVDDPSAQDVLQITGYDNDRLRRLHLEESQPPARLLDALQRRQLHQQYPRLRGAAFEQHFVERQWAPSAAEALLQRDFPGLTARTAKAIVEQADELLVERMVDQQRVPLALAEQARWMLRDIRLDRACAGLYQAQAVNADTERLAFGLLDQWVSWPDTLRIELHEASSGALPLVRMGAPSATDVRVIVKRPQGYQALDGLGAPLQGTSTHDSLIQAMFRQLGEMQLQALGKAGESAKQLAQALAQQAFMQRDDLPALLGMAPDGGRVRPPVRLGDGRLGYPLSGRGESSTGALRQAIRRLFPTFTDVQAEAFIASAGHQGMTPWHFYFHHHNQLRILVDTLSNWRRASASPAQALRRVWVARTIRRAWQRQSVDTHGNLQLCIHGWRVGALPNLPEAVDFSHVTRLSLRNMSLLEIEPGFLRRFGQVRSLDLRGNLLTTVPASIEHLVELVELNLADNHIGLTSEGSRSIAALRRLVALDLHDNLLGRSPDVSMLFRLRSLNLRMTGLRELPLALLESPSLTLIDLRENSISELPDAVLQLLARDPERVFLHDNPLSPRAVSRLRELMQSRAADVLPVRVHDQSLEDERLRWLEGVAPTDQARRLKQWDRLAAEAGAQDLFRFFADLSRSADFLRQPQEMCRRVWGIIEACELNGEVREAVFQQAAGPRSCADQMLLILSALEVRTLMAQRTAGLEGRYAMHALLRLGRELFRLDQVDRIANRHIQQQRVRDSDVPVDDVEVHLAYRVGLAGALDLPGQPSSMNYASASGVGSADLTSATREVLAAEDLDALSRSLVEREFWQQYLQGLYADRFEAMNAPFHERLELMFELREVLSDQAFREAAETVQAERLLAERALLLQLTRQAYDQHPS